MLMGLPTGITAVTSQSSVIVRMSLSWVVVFAAAGEVTGHETDKEREADEDEHGEGAHSQE
jgi:hypothetical protein